MAEWPYNFLIDRGMRAMSVHERFYGLATQEIEEGVRREDLWTKAYVLSGGDAQKAKVLYIELLAQLMADSFARAEKRVLVKKIRNKVRLFWKNALHFCRIFLSIYVIMWLWAGIFKITQELHAIYTGNRRASIEEIALNSPGTLLISICFFATISFITCRFIVRTSRR